MTANGNVSADVRAVEHRLTDVNGHREEQVKFQQRGMNGASCPLVGHVRIALFVTSIRRDRGHYRVNTYVNSITPTVFPGGTYE